VNPRASRTVPFVSKATGVPLAKIAARLMNRPQTAANSFRENIERSTDLDTGRCFFVKSVFPWVEIFPASTPFLLGPRNAVPPERVMGASAPAQLSARSTLPKLQIATGPATPD